MDGPCGCVGVWMCWHADALRMGVDMDPCKKKKEKKRKEKRKYILPEVGMSMWMGCVEMLSCRCADGCKQKRKKKKTWWVPSVWMGLWVCRRADGHAAVWACRCRWL